MVFDHCEFNGSSHLPRNVKEAKFTKLGRAYTSKTHSGSIHSGCNCLGISSAGIDYESSISLRTPSNEEVINHVV